MLLEGKVVIVSGAGPGLGQALIVLAAREGARVAVSARTPEKLDAAEREIRELGLQVEVLKQPTDIRDAAQCDVLAAATLDRFGRIDGLINSAYVSPPACPIETADFDDWRNTIDTNLFGTLNMCRAVLPAMKAQEAGSIVNISTMATRKPFEGLGGYTASKAALNALTRLMAKEWGGYGIRVNTVIMGWMWGSTVQSRMQGRADAGGLSVEDQVRTVSAGIPLPGIPSDRQCAGAAMIMLSDHSSQVTGATLDCNGGEFMAL